MSLLHSYILALYTNPYCFFDSFLLQYLFNFPNINPSKNFITFDVTTRGLNFPYPLSNGTNLDLRWIFASYLFQYYLWVRFLNILHFLSHNWHCYFTSQHLLSNLNTSSGIQSHVPALPLFISLPAITSF